MIAQTVFAPAGRTAWRRWPRLWLLMLLACAALPREGHSLGQETYVEGVASENSFALAAGGRVASVYVDPKDWPGVIRAAGDLQADLRRVTGLTAGQFLAANTVIVGTVGKSPTIDRLVASGKIDPKAIAGKWESFFIQVVADPLPGVSRAAVIVGSDKRGTIYGIYDLSGQIGVSPWYWWDDVTPTHRDTLFIKAGKFQQGEPSVKYRGIFLNDEAPDLTNWVKATYGDRDGVADYGHEFYARIFEAILRMKGNYLWPAMWDNAFNEDDPENPRLADEYGIVMGTSHQEPMLRAQKEWDRRHPKTPWNYATAPADLRSFWHEGISRNKDYESILTIGLRGANDTPMIRGGDTDQAIGLLKRIIADQRTMIAEVYGQPAWQVPQLWCPYKEVLDYYDADPTMRAPDDVTMLWTDDNWGNLRRLPDATERARRGGSGIYYHFDYVGGPRNYKWINANPLPKIWDQMNLAKTWGADRIWIANVGHFKGYEIPIEYFLQLGWNSDRWTGENIDEWTRLWATREFGPAHAAEIADIVTKYTRYNGRRKPELLAPGTFSVADYHEADTVVIDFKAIVAQAKTIMAQLPKEKQDAFYELVLFPALASEQVDELHVDAGKNALYAAQGRASANDFADATKTMFEADGSLMAYFNQTFAGGKWNHFMDQIHLGYVSWKDPEKSAPPMVKAIALAGSAAMGVALEGSSQAWPGGSDDAALPRFDALNRQTRIVEVFNRGQDSFQFTATASEPWIQLSAARGTVEKDFRLGVRIDWSKAPADVASGLVRIKGVADQVTVKVEAWRPADVTRETLQGFAEDAGVVSIEAEHFTKKTGTDTAHWDRIANYGRTLSGMRATAPPDTAVAVPGTNLPCLEYRLYLADAGPVKATFIVGPTLNFVAGRALRMAVSIDDDAPATVEIVPADYKVGNERSEWGQAVKDNAHLVHADLAIPSPGYHTLKVWMMDPAVVLEKIVLDFGGETVSYLGPPESYRGTAAAAP